MVLDLFYRVSSIFLLFIIGLGSLHAQGYQSTFAIDGENAAYADVADLVTISPVIVDAIIRKTQKVPAEQAAGVPENIQRMLILADVTTLIRGQGGVPAQIRFVLDIPKDSRGKLPKLKKARFFVLARNGKGQPGDLILSRPDAMIAYSPSNDALVRAITREVVQLGAAQKIISVSRAYYSGGTVIGEGETQIFLSTENRQPMAITIASKPDKPKQWTVSTSELIEETAAIPRRNTLLWYRLACGLPRDLPSDAIDRETPGAIEAAKDYRFVVSALGSCGRRRK
jgi:hypothetical protein